MKIKLNPLMVVITLPVALLVVGYVIWWRWHPPSLVVAAVLVPFLCLMVLSLGLAVYLTFSGKGPKRGPP